MVISLPALRFLADIPFSIDGPSRWPHHDLKFHTRCRIALQVTIAGPSQPVTLYNVHLDSRITLKERISQVLPVVEEASALNGPVVVARGLQYRGRSVAVESAADTLRRKAEQEPATGISRSWFRLTVGWYALDLRYPGIPPASGLDLSQGPRLDFRRGGNDRLFGPSCRLGQAQDAGTQHSARNNELKIRRGPPVDGHHPPRDSPATQTPDC